jgi:hypothetical protein
MKKNLLFISLLTFNLSINLFAQSTLQIGNKVFPGLTTNTYGPMNTWFGAAPVERANRHACIYPLQAIGAMPVNSSITGIQWYRNVTALSGANGVAGSLNGAPYLKVYLKNTALNTYSGVVTWADSAATSVEVFNGDPTTFVGNATGWVTVPFSQSVTYAGGNLAILTEYGQTQSTSNTVVWSYDTSSVSPTVTANYFNSTQCRYNAPVTTYASGKFTFPATTSGSNVRHPSLIINYTAPPLLPVELADFQGKKVASGAQLMWKTALEENFAYFILEKSEDGKIWQNIAQINAKKQRLGSEYAFWDTKMSKNALYRLKIVDRDGSFEFSKIISIEQQNASDIVLFPSLAADNINLVVEKKAWRDASFYIFNTEGKIMKTFTLTDYGITTIDVSELPSGIYWVKNIDANLSFCNRFIKN